MKFLFSLEKKYYKKSNIENIIENIHQFMYTMYSLENIYFSIYYNEKF
jgi:hypothetical protein